MSIHRYFCLKANLFTQKENPHAWTLECHSEASNKIAYFTINKTLADPSLRENLEKLEQRGAITATFYGNEKEDHSSWLFVQAQQLH